jgi:hypothetical protein
MIRVFCGYDPREAVGFHVFTESLIRTSSVPIAIIPVQGDQKDGTNAFTYARFLVPHLCSFDGMAIFVDGSDMLMRQDIADLVSLYDPKYAVQVIQHDYHTTHERKYLGTDMEADNRDYPRKNWSSVVLWNCEHPRNRWMTPQNLKGENGSYLHRFSWLKDEEIGTLPAKWNVLVGEVDSDNAAIAHYTLGIPSIWAYQGCKYSGDWQDMLNKSMTAPANLPKIKDLCIL